jgi:hypothetical protein
MTASVPRIVPAVVAILVLMGIDMALPQGICISMFYALPLYWLAWHGERRAAWLIGLLTPFVFLFVARPLAGRPPATWEHGVNWSLLCVKVLVCVELIWRGRWYVDRLGEALDEAKRQARREARERRRAEGGT